MEFECPHCGRGIWIEKNEINCGIFRDAVLKSNGEQINPHETKLICDKLVADGEVWGCAKPFRIVLYANKWSLEKCDYI